MARYLNIAARIVALFAIGFISVFALDVFSGPGPLGAKLIGLVIHLTPSMVLGAVLAVAWRWPWAGTAFVLIGLLPLVGLSNPFWVNVMLGGPFLAAGILFGLAAYQGGRQSG